MTAWLSNILRKGGGDGAACLLSLVFHDRAHCMAQSCIRGGSDSTLGKTSFLRGLFRCLNRLPREVIDVSCVSVQEDNALNDRF